MDTVSFTRQNNLCISCGICAAVCPEKCITFQDFNGMRLPAINDSDCVHCGKCFNVCPGKGFNYSKYSGELNLDFNFHDVKGIYTVRSKNESILKNAVSGGAVTEIISGLIDGNSEYKSAFVVRGHDYADVPCSEIVSSTSELYDSQKSRYVIISHQKCAEYIISHSEQKIILVGTGCFVHGIMNLISMYGLKRENYFIIGLFCDRTMSMNVIRYFKNHRALTSGLKELYFRTKDSGGWPGGMRLVGNDGNIIDLPNSERMKVKDYFQPERCLYCLDKLNIFADISAGDNYTGRNGGVEGSSSIIIRTDEGLRVWKELSDRFEVHESDRNEIITSQKLKKRQENYFFSKLKEKETGREINGINFGGVKQNRNILKEYRKRIYALRLGSHYAENPAAVIRDIRIKKAISAFKRLSKKMFKAIFRKGQSS